jgi:hypothetical protein
MKAILHMNYAPIVKNIAIGKLLMMKNGIKGMMQKDSPEAVFELINPIVALKK